MKYVMPSLSEALLDCSKIKPEDPVDFLVRTQVHPCSCDEREGRAQTVFFLFRRLNICFRAINKNNRHSVGDRGGSELHVFQ